MCRELAPQHLIESRILSLWISKMSRWLKSLVSFKFSVDLVWWAVIMVGVILRLRQYVADRSLWNDEAALALNIVNRNFAGLTQPLSYNQGAPLGFLFIEKALLLIIGNHDYILRLFPLFSGLLSLYFIYLISKQYFGTPGLFALSIFSISWTLIYYSSELKQYSSDVLISTGLIYLAFRPIQKDAGPREILLLGTGGIISVWMSHPAIFVLASMGVALAIEYLDRRAFSLLAWALGIGMAWLIDFGIEYMVFLRHLIGNSYLQQFWQPYFMPLPPWSNLKWFGSTYLQLLGLAKWLQFVPTWYFALISSFLLVLGIGWFFIRN